MKKSIKRVLALVLAMMMVLGISTTAYAQEMNTDSQPESVSYDNTIMPLASIDSAPFIYTGNISDAKNWSPKYSMRVIGGSITFKVGITAQSGTAVSVEVFNSSGTSLGIKSYNLIGTTGHTFTYGTLGAGSYTYRFMFLNGSGTYILQFGT